MKSLRFLLLVTLSVLSIEAVNAQITDNGKKAFYYGKLNEAKAYYQKQVNPANKNIVEPLYALGKIYLTENKLDSAQASFSKAIEANKDALLGYVGRMGVNFAKKDVAAGNKEYEYILDNVSKKDVNTFVETIYMLVHFGPDQAPDKLAELVDKVKAYDKKNWEMYLSLGDFHYNKSEGSKAIEYYRTANDFNNKNVVSSVNIGKVYTKIKNYGAAELSFKEALAADSTCPIAFEQLAEMQLTLKQYNKAADNYKKFLSFTEVTTANKIQYSKILYLNKNYAETIEFTKSILAADPTNFRIRQLEAYAYYELENLTDGVASFEKYMVDAPKADVSATDYEYLGMLLKKGGKDQDAMAKFQQAIGLDSTKAYLYGEIAGIYYKAKDYVNASNAYMAKEKKGVKPLDGKELFELGLCYYFQKSYTEADTTFKKLNAIRPDMPQAYFFRAQVNAQIDTTFQLGLAKPHYEKFIELALKDAKKFKGQLVQAYTYLANYFILNKERDEFKEIWKEKGKSYLEKVLELDPENEPAKDAMKGIK